MRAREEDKIIAGPLTSLTSLTLLAAVSLHLQELPRRAQPSVVRSTQIGAVNSWLRNQPAEVVSAAVASLHEALAPYVDGASVRLPGAAKARKASVTGASVMSVCSCRATQMSPPFPFQKASMSALISSGAAIRVLLLSGCARCGIAERTMVRFTPGSCRDGPFAMTAESSPKLFDHLARARNIPG